MDKRETTLQIIREHNLDPTYIGRICGVTRWVVVSYIQQSGRIRVHDWWIEDSIIGWYEKMKENRRKLLVSTQYAHLYK